MTIMTIPTPNQLVEPSYFANLSVLGRIMMDSGIKRDTTREWSVLCDLLSIVLKIRFLIMNFMEIFS